MRIEYWLGKTNWDGILLGNMDLIGHELLKCVKDKKNNSTSYWVCASTISP